MRRAARDQADLRFAPTVSQQSPDPVGDYSGRYIEDPADRDAGGAPTAMEGNLGIFCQVS